MANTLSNNTTTSDHLTGIPRDKPLIMVVGPNAELRLMLRMLLEDWNYDVIEAVSTDESPAFSPNRRPALILQDSTTIHSSDGLDDLNPAAYRDGLNDIPSLMLSGFSQAGYTDAGTNDRIPDLLQMPLDFDMLREYLGKMVDGNRFLASN